MRIFTTFSSAAFLIATASSFAQPTFSLEGAIDVSSVGTTPTDIVFVGNEAYFAEFSSNAVGVITNPLTPGSASVSQAFGTSSGNGLLAGATDYAFDADAGLVSLDYDGTNLLVSGSIVNNSFGATADDGALMLVDPAGPTLVEDMIVTNGTGIDGGNAVYTGAGFFYGTAGQIVTAFGNGTNLWQWGTDLSSVGFIGGGTVGTFGRFITDAETYDTGSGQEVYLAGNTRFFAPDPDLSEPAGTAAILNIRRYNPGSDTDDFSTATAVPGTGTMGNGNDQAWFELFSSVDIADNAYQGLGIYDDGTQVLIMLANTVGNEVLFIDRATGAQVSSLSITAPTDVTAFDDGSNIYLLVSQEGGQISVFSDGATSVSNWEVYN